MAITTMDGLIAAIAASQDRAFQKAFTGPTQGAPMSMWSQPGIPGAGATPSSGIAGDVPTDTTAGAIPFTNPGSGSSYLTNVSMGSNVSGILYLYDRLWHNSGVSSTLTTGQTVNSVALTRPDANGADVEAWWQVYATMGAGTPTVTLSYTNQSGTAAQSASSGAFTSAMGIGRTGPFRLAAGDTGVRSIQTWTSSATFTSGTIGLVLRRRIGSVSIGGNGAGSTLDAFGLGLPLIYNDACIEGVYIPVSTSAALMIGRIAIGQG